MSPEQNSPGDSIPLEILPHNVPRETKLQLQKFVDLVFRWQGSINLTGAKSPQEFFHHHVLDCLGALEGIPKFEACIDVGSGCGLPGLVWAILRPQAEFLLVEVLQKRAAFLRRVQSHLELNKVRIFSDRFEKLRPEQAFGARSSVVVSRGTSSPQKLLPLMKSSPVPFSSWYVFASERTAEEFLTLQANSAMQFSLRRYRRHLEAGEPAGILVEAIPAPAAGPTK